MRKLAPSGEGFERYNALYAQAQEVIARINPCEIQIVDGKASCVSTRGGSERDSGLCCHHCQYLTTIGCSIKSLACKLWLCFYVEQTTKGRQARRELRELEMQAYAADVPMPFRDSPFVIL